MVPPPPHPTPPPKKKKVCGTFFLKKFCMGKKLYWANLLEFIGGCFTWGLMIRSCKEEELVVGRNLVCCLIIVAIFMRLRRAYRLRGDFKVTIWGQATKEWNHFYGRS